jgi:hypothetical protein
MHIDQANYNTEMESQYWRITYNIIDGPDEPYTIENDKAMTMDAARRIQLVLQRTVRKVAGISTSIYVVATMGYSDWCYDEEVDGYDVVSMLKLDKAVTESTLRAYIHTSAPQSIGAAMLCEDGHFVALKQESFEQEVEENSIISEL